jgi:LysR family transcriptional activator of nhaA
VAREGSISAASKLLRLAHPTISGQVHRLEEVLGEKLFVRTGRRLALTDQGRVAFRYADEIFALGREFVDTLEGRATATRPLRLVVGVADILPSSLVRRFLEPALHIGQPVQLFCRAATAVEELVAALALHTVDVVIADGPAALTQVRAYSHLLGECGTTFFAAPALAATTRRRFPAGLDGAPLLLPGLRSSVRRALDQWLTRLDLRPRIVGEFDDSALAKVFGKGGHGVFTAPTVIEAEVVRDHGVEIVGRAPTLRQQFYAISVERKIRHPAVAAICDAARQALRAPPRRGAKVTAPAGSRSRSRG